MTEGNGTADTVAISEIDNLDSIIQRFSTRLGDIEDRLDDLEARLDDDRDDREINLEKILEAAPRFERENKAVMDYSQIMAAANVSAPTAYDYMERLVSQHDWITPYKGASGKKRIVLNLNERPADDRF